MISGFLLKILHCSSDINVIWLWCLGSRLSDTLPCHLSSQSLWEDQK